MKDTLQKIVASIVDNESAVEVTEQEEEGMTTFTINVAPEDMGKVIGKEGKVIRALRNIMKIPAMKQGKRINISLADTNQPN